MKKQLVFFIPLASFLLLSSCGQNAASSSSEDASSVSESIPSLPTSIDVDEDWVDWSSEKKELVSSFVEASKAKEKEVTHYVISNKEGSNDPKQYTYKVGKDSSGEAMYLKTAPSSETYYFKENGKYVSLTARHNGGKVTYSKNEDVSPSDMSGVDLYPYMLTPTYEKGIYGGYESLSRMVAWGIENPNKDTKFMIKADGFDMKFMFEKSSAYFLSEISARFSSSGLLTSIDYKYAQTYKSKVDIAEDGTFSVKEDTVINYKQTSYVADNAPAETMSLPVNLTDFEYTSFDLYFGENKIDLEVEGGNPVVISEYGVVLDVKNILPETASSTFDEWKIVTRTSTGIENTESNYFDYASSSLVMSSIMTPGVYSVTITTKNIRKTFSLSASAPLPTEIQFLGLVSTNTGMSETEAKTTISVGDKTNLITYVTPSVAIQDVDIEISAPSGVNESDYSWTQKTYSSGGRSRNYFEFSSTKGGNFVFTATSKADPSVKGTHTIKVVAPMTPEDVFSGKYVYANPTLIYTFEFTPNKETALEGDGLLKITGEQTGYVGYYTYAPNAAGTAVSLTYEERSGCVQEFFDARITSGGNRGSLSVKFKDSPVGWSTTINLTDWEDYINK